MLLGVGDADDMEILNTTTHQEEQREMDNMNYKDNRNFSY